MELHAVKAFFDEQAQRWDSVCHHDMQKLRYILSVCDLLPGQRILDIACGTGVLFSLLLEAAPARLVGVDLSEAMLRVAQKKLQDARLQLLAADFLGMEESGFDRAILYSAYPHFFDKAALAKKLWAALAPGGRVTIAHSQGREQINAMHTRRGADPISVPLQSGVKERRWFDPWFSIDTCVDTKELFVLSGIKRADV